MRTEAVLLKLSVSDGVVREVVSTGPGDHSHLCGFSTGDLIHPLPSSSRFSPVSYTPEGRAITAAARTSGGELFVYHLQGAGSEICAGVPYIRLSQGAALPIASPGMVVLLGYTPWELMESDLLQSLISRVSSEPGPVTLIDRWGSLRDMLCASSTGADGTLWIWMTPFPHGAAAPWERVIGEWERLPLSSAEAELDFLLKASELPVGALIDRSGEEAAVLASRGLRIEKTDLAPGGAYASEVSGTPVWLDLEDGTGGSGTGHIYLAPFGRADRYLAVLGGATSPILAGQKVRVLLPVLAMRLDLWNHARSAAEQESRRALLDDLEQLLQTRGVSSTGSLGPCLEAIAAEIGALEIVLFPGDRERAAVARPGIPRASVDALDAGRGGPFQAVASVRLRGGHRLAAGFQARSSADNSVLKALGRMLERYCRLDAPVTDDRPEGLDALPVMIVDGFDVVWQGGGTSHTRCFEQWNRTGPCDGCPLEGPQHGSANHRMLREGSVEEIIPSGERHIIMTVQIPSAPEDQRQDRLPGGVAGYDEDGIVTAWSSWLEAVTGVGAAVAVGQWAGRLLEKLGSDRLSRQFEQALRGRFLPESVEFTVAGRRCMSRMTQGPQASGINHFILDSVSAGLGDLSLFAGPGLTAPGEPASLAAPLSSACERLGWELDISNPAGECGTQTWLSPSILSEFFPELLRIMAPMCPEKWVALDSQSCEQAAAKNTRAVLPGAYHLLQFGVYPVLLDSQQASIASLDRELQTLGGWVSKPAQGENLTLALPAALKRRKPGRLVVYSTDEWFREFTGETLATAVPDWRQAGSLEELSALQPEADLLVLRLRPYELGIIASLWARVPDQGMLVASGLRPQLPFLASRIELLQLPATSEELLGAVRRMLIG